MRRALAFAPSAWKTQGGHSPQIGIRELDHIKPARQAEIASLGADPTDGRYFLFPPPAPAFRTVALLDAIGVQISTVVGTRSLPAAKSASSVDD